MTPCPVVPMRARRHRAVRRRAAGRAMSSCCCSTASTGTCWAATAGPSSRRRTSTASPASGPSVSRRMSPARCRACRRVTTSCAARSTSCGGRGAPSRSGRSPSPRHLRRAGVTTMLVSDHPHLFEVGGENYHTDFSAWDYVRGHEGDPWRTYPDPSFIGAPALPARGGGWFWRDRLGWAEAEDRPYDRSRTFFRAESDYPGPKTMRAAAGWLRDGAPGPDGAPFMLFVDEFDPHEPFDTPEPWAGRYDPDWDGELLIWPPYDVGAVAAGRLSEREGRQIRANYGAKLSMIDHWVGEVFDALDRARAVGEHGGGGVHGPWALSRREGHLGEARSHAVRAVGPHSAAGALARRRRRDDMRRADDQRRHQRHAGGRVRCAARRRRGLVAHGTSLAPLLRGEVGAGAGVGHRRRLRELGPSDRRPPQVRPRGATATTFLCRCGPTVGRPCRCTGSRMPSVCPRPTGGPASTSCRAPTCRSSGSRSSPVTVCPSGSGATRSTRTSCSTCRRP